MKTIFLIHIGILVVTFLVVAIACLRSHEARRIFKEEIIDDWQCELREWGIWFAIDITILLLIPFFAEIVFIYFCITDKEESK